MWHLELNIQRFLRGRGQYREERRRLPGGVVSWQRIIEQNERLLMLYTRLTALREPDDLHDLAHGCWLGSVLNRCWTTV